MASAMLNAAFWWECEECGKEQFIKANVGELTEDEAAEALLQFETVDAVQGDEEDQMKSEYLVTRVVIGPAFVQCESCGKMHATALPVEQE